MAANFLRKSKRSKELGLPWDFFAGFRVGERGALWQILDPWSGEEKRHIMNLSFRYAGPTPTRQVFFWKVPPCRRNIAHTIRYLHILVCMYNIPGTPNNIYKWMFGETNIFYIKIWNHPIETSIYKWLFGAPGIYIYFLYMQLGKKRIWSHECRFLVVARFVHSPRLIIYEPFNW